MYKEHEITVTCINGKWVDNKGREYTPVRIEQIVGYNRKNTIKAADKRLLSHSPEGAAYVEYNEQIGGDRIGLHITGGYPPRIQAYLEEGHTIEQIYRECTEAGVSWEERFRCYYDPIPEALDGDGNVTEL